MLPFWKPWRRGWDPGWEGIDLHLHRAPSSCGPECVCPGAAELLGHLLKPDLG